LASQSEGPHDLLRDGGLLVRNPQDVLDAVCGLGVRAAVDPVVAALSDEQRVVLEAIRSGTDTMAELSRTGVADGRLLTVLAGLELAGCLRRAAGGRYVDIA
jgi:predicted Rossmann fold nucleotide-binding protein DprA/Smf involved in DNA uptake